MYNIQGNISFLTEHIIFFGNTRFVGVSDVTFQMRPVTGNPKKYTWNSSFGGVELAAIVFFLNKIFLGFLEQSALYFLTEGVFLHWE